VLFFHVTLLNILGFVHLPEKVLEKYFEIKGVFNLITCSNNGYVFLGGRGGGGELLSDGLTSQFNNKRIEKIVECPLILTF
jgi:hypothetical protein